MGVLSPENLQTFFFLNSGIFSFGGLQYLVDSFEAILWASVFLSQKYISAKVVTAAVADLWALPSIATRCRPRGR